MNLISETHHSYEKKKHTFMVPRKYTIIFHCSLEAIVEFIAIISGNPINGFDLDNSIRQNSERKKILWSL